MTKNKLFFSAAIIATLVNHVYAGNVNQASVGYVQEQVAVLNSKIANIPVTPTYTVGQQALGGIVFYVNSNGPHGLVANTAFVGLDNTWDGGLSNTTADFQVNSIANGIGAGAMNTSLIVGAQSAYAALQSTTLSNMAAQYCLQIAVKEDGVTPCGTTGSAEETCYADYYLPSAYELNQMYLQNGILKIWQSSSDPAFLWSSTEVGANAAYRINFSDSGSPLPAGKDSQCSAWCIRQF